MADKKISARVIGVIAGGFVLLVAVQLWLHQAEQAGNSPDQPTFSPAEVEGVDQQIALGDEQDRRPGRPTADELTRRKIKKLRNGTVSERRSAAVRLTFHPHPAAEEALLAGLKDRDRHVREQCAQALLKVWRISDSRAAEKLLSRALNAYERGRWDAALTHLNDCSRMDPDIPEVYRLRARIWLRRNRPQKALADAKRALSLEQNHFRAHYLAARALLKQGKKQKARQKIERALAIYSSFDEARSLRKKLKYYGLGP